MCSFLRARERRWFSRMRSAAGLSDGVTACELSLVVFIFCQLCYILKKAKDDHLLGEEGGAERRGF